MEAIIAELNVRLCNLCVVPCGVENGWEEIREWIVPIPLSEDGEAAITCEAVSACSGLEQGALVPPALVGALHVQKLLVFGQLKLHPRRISVAIAVVLGQHAYGCLLLALDTKPSW